MPQPNTVSQPIERAVDFLRGWLPYRFANADMPGLSVAVWSGGDLCFSEAYGLADSAARQPLTTAHLFRTASQTKMFTATILLQLVEQGTVRLDDPVVQYLPWLAQHTDSRFRQITIRQLATHSAGLARDCPDADYWYMTEPFPSQARLRALALASQLVLEPNTALKYSNLGYAVLGQVLAVATEKNWSDLMQSVFASAGLQSAWPDWSSMAKQAFPTGYGMSFQKSRQPLGQRPANAFGATAGVCASPEDLCRFAAAHFLGDKRLLSDQAKHEMQRSQWTVGSGYDAGYAYGLGFEITIASGRRLMGHTGHMGGHTTVTYFDPQDQLAVSVAANCKDAPVEQIARGIIGCIDFFAANLGQPSAAHTRFTGRFYSPLAVIEVIAAGNRLLLIDPDEWSPLAWSDELEIVGPNELRIATAGNTALSGERILYRQTQARAAAASISYLGMTMHPDAGRAGLLKS